MTYNLQSNKLVDAVASVCMQTGLFEKVNQHEPKSTPGNGLSAAVWVQEIHPSTKISGMASTAAVVTFMIRLQTSFLSEPQDLIDPTIMNAVDDLMGQFSDEFTMSGQVFSIDLLGAEGAGLSAKAGYLNQGGKLFRVMDMTIRMSIDAVWSQTP